MNGAAEVARIFDEMRGDYDEIRDLWYAWLFSRLHGFLADFIAREWEGRPRDVLDAGCGTGFQSFLYSWCGCQVTGCDVSGELVAAATGKAGSVRPFEPLFPEAYRFVARYNRRIAAKLRATFGSHTPRTPVFAVGDVTRLGFSSASFDHINCCGSVLSLVEDHRLAIAELARVLRPGGTFLIEVEAKFNCDLVWAVVDAMIGGRLGYHGSWKEALEPFQSPVNQPVRVDYPFGETDAPVWMPITLFTRAALERELSAHGLRATAWRSIHSFTNLIPSTLLDTAPPGTALRALFLALATVEEWCPIQPPGASLLVWGRKVGHA